MTDLREKIEDILYDKIHEEWGTYADATKP